jgi:hypothetical protein
MNKINEEMKSIPKMLKNGITLFLNERLNTYHIFEMEPKHLIKVSNT